MISDQSCSRVEGKDRIEDTLPDCKEKLDFEKRIELYLYKIRQCNAEWVMIKDMRGDKFYTAAQYAPTFWQIIPYALQMNLVTELTALLSDDEESFAQYFKRLTEEKDRVFTRRFFSTWRDADTGEEHEQEWENALSFEQAYEMCHSKLVSLKKKQFEPLRNARNKIYCHLTSISTNIEKGNELYLNKLTNDLIDTTLSELGYIIGTLYALYSNIQPATKYANQNDIRGVFRILRNTTSIRIKFSSYAVKNLKNN